MIPPRRRDGTLPPGIHRATLSEFTITYPPSNEQRQILSDSLHVAILALRNLDASFDIFVDGSYITSKVEPNDVDVLVKTDRYLETELQTYLEQTCPVEAVSLDVNVEPTTSTYLLDFLMTDDYGRAKGIVQLI